MTKYYDPRYEDVFIPLQRQIQSLQTHLTPAFVALRLNNDQLNAVAQAVHMVDNKRMQEAVQVASHISKLLSDIPRVDAAVLQELSRISQHTDEIGRVLAANAGIFNAIRRVFEQQEPFKGLQDRLQSERNSAEAFSAAGWPIAPSMPRWLKRRVIQLYEQDKVRYAGQAIIGCYKQSGCKYLVDAVEKWNSHPLFAPRMHIIRDALWAHQNRKYTLSFPALIPQVEGIMSEYVISNGLPAKLGSIKAVYEAVVGDPAKNYPLFVWAIADTLLYQLQTNTYFSTDFAGELEKRIPKRRTTRHTVLHGIMPGYNRASHSLRSFLVLDALSALQEYRYEDQA
ncbi:MAG TPA: hypothetical protein VJM51_07470 [Dehalococcoidia bacterium]|nr:hypothetical protein [Dehalococcoidia bacterium]